MRSVVRGGAAYSPRVLLLSAALLLLVALVQSCAAADAATHDAYFVRSAQARGCSLVAGMREQPFRRARVPIIRRRSCLTRSADPDAALVDAHTTGENGWLRVLTREGVEANPGPAHRRSAEDATECVCKLSKQELLAAGLGVFAMCQTPGCGHTVGHHEEAVAAAVAAVAPVAVPKKPKRFTQLLSDRHLGRYALSASSINNKVLLRIERDFSSRMLVAVSQQDPDAALRLYDEVSEMPSTTTIAQLRIEGIAPIGAVYGTTISSCITEQGEEKVIKVLETREAAKYKELADHVTHIDLAHHLVPFSLYQRRSGALLALMPQFPHTAEALPLRGNLLLIARFIHDITIALSELHRQRRAHMDVKPSNVFVSQGRFYLGDFGSATEFGQRVSETTIPFIPVDLERSDDTETQASARRLTGGGWKADAAHDWWMFAATVADKLFELRLKGARAPTCGELLRMLERHGTDVQVRGLCDRLIALLSVLPQPPHASSVRLLTPSRVAAASASGSPFASPFLPRAPAAEAQPMGAASLHHGGLSALFEAAAERRPSTPRTPPRLEARAVAEHAELTRTLPRTSPSAGFQLQSAQGRELVRQLASTRHDFTEQQ